MTLSLDANVLIDLANGRSAEVRRNFDQALIDGEALVTCALAAHELLYGAAISGRPDAQMKIAKAILSDVSAVAFTESDAEAAAYLRRQLRRRGRGIGAFDTLIAGQSLGRGWTMVTGNVREFDRVDGLQIVDWTHPPESA
jgi:tRNA(fMet)-specific endonuclease VapC